MGKMIISSAMLVATLVLSGCQTWHSPYRGNQWRMDQVMDGDPYREGDGNRGSDNSGNTIIRR